MASLFIVLAVCLAHFAAAGNYPGSPEMKITEAACGLDATVCRFDLEIEEKWTMMLETDMFWAPVTAESDGLHLKNKDTCSNEDKDALGPKLSDHQVSKVIPADGEYERVLSINGSVPGM